MISRFVNHVINRTGDNSDRKSNLAPTSYWLLPCFISGGNLLIWNVNKFALKIEY